MNSFKPVLFFVFTIILSFAFILVVHGIGTFLFFGKALVQPENEDISDWVTEYIKFAGWYGISITAIGTILWYIIGQWGIKVIKPDDSGKRGIWAGLFIFPLLGTLVSLLVLMSHPVQFGIHWIIIFSILIPFLCYWLVTVLLSPISYKYTPLGASKIRYW
jgi:uncharacterized membrane protein YhaH (DUF805 family)